MSEWRVVERWWKPRVTGSRAMVLVGAFTLKQGPDVEESITKRRLATEALTELK